MVGVAHGPEHHRPERELADRHARAAEDPALHGSVLLTRDRHRLVLPFASPSQSLASTVPRPGAAPGQSLPYLFPLGRIDRPGLATAVRPHGRLHAVDVGCGQEAMGMGY